MAEETKPETPPKGKKSNKIGGLPKPVVYLGAGVVVYLGYRWYKNRKGSTTTSTPIGATTPNGAGSIPGNNGGGWSGGGGVGTPTDSTTPTGQPANNATGNPNGGADYVQGSSTDPNTLTYSNGVLVASGGVPVVSGSDSGTGLGYSGSGSTGGSAPVPPMYSPPPAYSAPPGAPAPSTVGQGPNRAPAGTPPGKRGVFGL
jgi:hypothetical protein